MHQKRINTAKIYHYIPYDDDEVFHRLSLSNTTKLRTQTVDLEPCQAQ